MNLAEMVIQTRPSHETGEWAAIIDADATIRLINESERELAVGNQPFVWVFNDGSVSFDNVRAFASVDAFKLENLGTKWTNIVTYACTRGDEKMTIEVLENSSRGCLPPDGEVYEQVGYYIHVGPVYDASSYPDAHRTCEEARITAQNAGWIVARIK